MNRIALSLTVAALGFGMPVVPLHADQARTFVSAAAGDDGGGTNVDCLRLSPCKTFAQAAAHTLANGEITVLDPGSYGAVTITQNISIVNDGVGEAGILVSGGNTAITVNAPGAAVTLRGLTIKGIGFGGGDGIVFQAGKALNVENCTIRNLTAGGPAQGSGIIFVPSAGTANLTVTNTTITDNFNFGIVVQPSGSASVTGFLSKVGLHSNGFAGLRLFDFNTSGTLRFVVIDSAVSNNATEGFLGSARILLFLVRCVVANNGTGILSGGVVRTSQSAIMANGSGWATDGVISTYGDNLVVDSGNNTGTLTPIGKQ